MLIQALIFWNTNLICFEIAKKWALVSWSIHSFATFEVQIWYLCWLFVKTVTLWMQLCSSNNCLLPVSHTLTMWICTFVVCHLDWHIVLIGAYKFWYAVSCKTHPALKNLKNIKLKTCMLSSHSEIIVSFFDGFIVKWMQCVNMLDLTINLKLMIWT